MKLSHLSLAVLSAIALAACGGSGSSKHVEDPQPPKPPVTPEQPPKQDNEVEEPEKIVDPTETGVVGKLDFNKESSVGTTHYIRDEESDFDRVNNPKEKTVATSILGVNLNNQNPHLSNIALAKYVNEAGLVKMVQYLGVEGANADQITHKDSLQRQNQHNVQIPGNKGDENNIDLSSALTDDGTVLTWDHDGNAHDTASINDQIERVNKTIQIYKNSKNLTVAQKANLKQLLVVKEQLAALKAKLKDKAIAFHDGYILEKENQNLAWGDDVKTGDTVLDRSTSDAQVVNTPVTRNVTTPVKDNPDFGKVTAFVGTGPGALGLVGMSFQQADLDPSTEKVSVYEQGTEEKSKSSTRIFGRNFNAQGLKANYNSYSGATSVVKTASLTDYSSSLPANATATDADTYVDGTTNKALTYDLAVKPLQLENVQYGRVTGNLDPMDLNESELADSKTYFKEVPFLRHGEEKAVDTYFYRGPNATTLEQMAALPSGKEFVYAGHALMYGIDNKFHGNKTTEVPSAFGVNGSYGVGNFVRATFDVEAQRVKNGVVYNVWHDPSTSVQVQDALVTFDGNVFGNTVLGEAQRTYNKSDKADFRASFFGDKAEEMGGSFNSTTWQERYGAQGDIWGGVFGAQRTADKAAQLSNQQLGDIESLTPPAKQPKK